MANFIPCQKKSLEQKNQIFFEKAKDMVHISEILDKQWTKVVKIIVQLINILLIKENKDFILYEDLFRIKLSLERLRVFGYKMYTHIKRHKNKL